MAQRLNYSTHFPEAYNKLVALDALAGRFIGQYFLLQAASGLQTPIGKPDDVVRDLNQNPAVELPDYAYDFKRDSRLMVRSI